MNTTLMKTFLKQNYFAVVGASNNPSKFGYKVLDWYVQHQKPVTPINPTEKEILGIPCMKSISSLPHPEQTAISIITPPQVTETIINEAIQAKIPYLWLQPGAEHLPAVKKAQEAGIQVIYGGPCVMEDTKSLL